MFPPLILAFLPLLVDALHAKLVAILGVLLVQQRRLQQFFPRARLVARDALGEAQGVAVLGTLWVYRNGLGQVLEGLVNLPAKGGALGVRRG